MGLCDHDCSNVKKKKVFYVPIWWDITNRVIYIGIASLKYFQIFVVEGGRHGATDFLTHLRVRVGKGGCGAN